jgi:hypothetical protein
MVGKTLSAVTLHEPGVALSENYLKIRLAGDRGPNRLVDVSIGGLWPDGLREAGFARGEFVSIG